MATNDDKNLRQVYETLRREGYTPPEYEKFRQDMTADKNLRGVYETLRREGYTPPDYDTFRTDMLGNPQPAPAAPSAPTVLTAPAAPSGQFRAQGVQVPEIPSPENPSVDWSSVPEPMGEGIVPAPQPPAEPWQPSLRQKEAILRSINDRVGQTVSSLHASSAATHRIAQANTPEGRQRSRLMRQAARQMGIETDPIGIIRGSSSATSDQSPAPKPTGEGTVPPASTQNPTFHTVTTDDEGNLRGSWQLPDGSITDSFAEADRAVSSAREARLRQTFLSRMKQNGLDPATPEDIDEQRRRDTLDVAEKTLPARIERNEENIAKANSRRAQQIDGDQGSNRWDDSQGFWDNMARIIGGATRRSVERQHPAPRPEASLSQSDSELRALIAENYILDNARKRLEASHLRKSEGFMDGFWNINNLKNFAKGASHALSDGDIYTGGFMSISTASHMLAIEDKLKAGQDLSDAETSLLYSTMLGNDIQDNAHVPHGYTAGQTITRALPYIVQMMLNPASGLSRALVKKFGTNALKRIALTVAGDVAESAVLANTLQAPATAADAISRYQGAPVENPDGSISFDGDHDLTSAIAKAQGAAIIENYTEMLGNHFGVIGNFAGKTAAKGMRKVGLGKVVDNTSNLINRIKAKDWVKIIYNTGNRANINGTAGEILEEEAGIVLNSIFTGDNSLSDLTDYDTQVDIFLGVGLFGGFMGGVKAAGYPVARSRARRDLRTSDRVGSFRFGEDWDGIRSQIDQAEDSDLATIVRDLTIDHAQSPEQAKAIATYAHDLMRSRGFNLADVARRSENLDSPEQTAISDSFSHGEEIAGSGNSDAMAQAHTLMQSRRERLSQSTSPEWVDRLDSEDPVDALRAIPESDPELRQQAADYLSSKAVYDGMISAVQSGIDEEIAASDERVNASVNRTTGLIHPVSITGEEHRPAHIIDGEILIDTDGSIIPDQSSPDIIIRYDDTSEIAFSSPARIAQADPTLDPAAFRQQERDRIADSHARQAADAIEGVLPFTPGSSVIITPEAPDSAPAPSVAFQSEDRSPVPAPSVSNDWSPVPEPMGEGTAPANNSESAEANPAEAIIIGDTIGEDGTLVPGVVDVQLPDGSIHSMSKTDLQEQADARRDQAVTQFESDLADQRAQEKEQQLARQSAGLTDPRRDTSLLPDHFASPYAGITTHAARFTPADNGVGAVLYRDDNGNDAIVLAARSDGSYAGYMREYLPDGTPTDRWTAKFQNDTGDKSLFRTLMTSAQALLPDGHQLTEHSSVSPDGLRNLANQLRHGYSLQRDESGAIITTSVPINMASPSNPLQLRDYDPGSYDPATVHEDEFEAAADILTPYMQALGLTRDNIRFAGGRILVDHPILRKTESTRQAQPTAPPTPIAAPTAPTATSPQSRAEASVAPSGQSRAEGVQVPEIPSPENPSNDWSSVPEPSASNDWSFVPEPTGEGIVPTAETTAGPQQSAESPSALSRIPTDHDGSPIYEQADPATAWDAILEQTDGDTRIATDVISQTIAEKEADLRQLTKQKTPGGLSLQQKIEEGKRRKAAIDALQRDIDHWKAMAQTPALRKSQAEAEARARAEEEARLLAEQKAAQEAEARRIEAERKAAEKEEEENRKALAKIDRRYADIFDDVKEYPEAVSRLSQQEPEDILEVASIVLSRHKVLWGDTRSSKGTASETGFREGERKKLFSIFRRAENGGVSLQRLAEDVMQEYCEQYGIPYDNNEARDALIEMIRQASVPSDITQYIRRRRMEQSTEIADQLRRREEDMRQEWAQESYHMSFEDYESSLEDARRQAQEHLADFDPEEFAGAIADEIAEYDEIAMDSVEKDHQALQESPDYTNIAPSQQLSQSEPTAQSDTQDYDRLRENLTDEPIPEGTAPRRGSQVLPPTSSLPSRRNIQDEARPAIPPQDGPRIPSPQGSLPQGTPRPTVNRISKPLQQGKTAWINSNNSLHPMAQVGEPVPLNDSHATTSSGNHGIGLGIDSSVDVGKDNQKSSDAQIKSREDSDKPTPQFRAQGVPVPEIPSPQEKTISEEKPLDFDPDYVRMRIDQLIGRGEISHIDPDTLSPLQIAQIAPALYEMDHANDRVENLRGEFDDADAAGEDHSILSDIAHDLDDAENRAADAADRLHKALANLHQNDSTAGLNPAPEIVSEGTTPLDHQRELSQRQRYEEESKKLDADLSPEETDYYGKPLVLASDGTSVFGKIDARSGLSDAPIRLSLGVNSVGEDGKNHGYGLLHIEAGHGEQIRNAGYKSVVDFVENVAKNYTEIREGARIGDKPTYLLEVPDKHNNTLFIQLSRDGSFWNVNSAGIFNKKYSRRKAKVWSLPAVGEGTGIDTPQVNSGLSMDATAPAGNSSQTSTGKDNTPSANLQIFDEQNPTQDGSPITSPTASIASTPSLSPLRQSRAEGSVAAPPQSRAQGVQVPEIPSPEDASSGLNPATEPSPEGIPLPETKPWSLMNGAERIAHAEKAPLSTQEIDASNVDDVIKANAIRFLNGDRDAIAQISYLNAYENVRNTNRNHPAPQDSTSQQLDIPNPGESHRLGERAADGGNPIQLDTTDSSTQIPRQSTDRPDNPRVNTVDPREKGDSPIPERKPPVDPIPPKGDRPSRGSQTRGKGSNGRPKRGKTGGNPSLRDGAGHTPARPIDNGTAHDDLTRALDEFKSLLRDFGNAARDSLSINIALLNPRQIEMLPRLIVAGAKVGYALIRKGLTSFSKWSAEMRRNIQEPMAAVGITGSELDEWIDEMWNCSFTVDGATHSVREWASILGHESLRQKVAMTIGEKRKAQAQAEDIPVEIGSIDNIRQTLPFLLPQQQEDVARAETQFFDKSHDDHDHAHGKGYMFTNGTGTGKTYTGLGIVKRFMKQGKTRILILTPSQTKVSDWIKDAANLQIPLRSLDDWAKARATNATQEAGEGPVITTFANFRQNQALLNAEFDLVVYDESHRILENKKGADTSGLFRHYKISNKDQNHAFSRLRDIDPTWQQLARKNEEFKREYDKLMVTAAEKSGINRTYDLVRNGLIPPQIHEDWDARHIADYPKLAAIRDEVFRLSRKFDNEVKPLLQQKAKEAVAKTKVVFLSATPFNTRENLSYAEGYIFSYPKEDNSSALNPRSRFYLDHFGAAYKWRYNRLESSSSNPQAIAQQEIEFSDYLQNTLQTMSGRIIDSEFDYSRDFPTVTGKYAPLFNQAVEEFRASGSMSEATWRVLGDYVYSSALFESMKVNRIAPRIREHLERGRKIVVFHRRVETSEPLRPPFRRIFDAAVNLAMGEYDLNKREKRLAEIAGMRTKYAPLLEWEKTIDLRMPRQQLADIFGIDNILFFSGKESAKQKNEAVRLFNDDKSGKNIIVIQEASGKEGISLHDTTGNHPRVMISLALPQSPITALQTEGRIYRIGNRSNAIFEYPLLGLDSEMLLFGQKFNAQVGTTENLALGSKARNLRDSFARGVDEHSGDVSLDDQGIGGKEYDAGETVEIDPFDRAVLDFYGNRKLNGGRDNREGADYYPTPEPLGFKMAQWGEISEGESVLEPSAGHGAIARYVPRHNPLTAIEPSMSLFGRLQVKCGGVGRKFENKTFENYNVINKHDVILMNPPFGTAGRLAVDHLAKAFSHLEEGGRVVALIPRGSADAKFDKWFFSEKAAVISGEVQLPRVTFQQAGTAVSCRVLVIDKISNPKLASAAAARARRYNLNREYAKIEDFFADLRDVSMPARTIDHNARLRKKAAPVARELRSMKKVTEVELDNDGIRVIGRYLNSASINWALRTPENLPGYLQDCFNRFSGYAAEEWRGPEAQAVYAEMAALAARLAGKTVEEMTRTPSSDIRTRLGDDPLTFQQRQRIAVGNRGTVMPGLNEAVVKVVEVPKHGYNGDKPLSQAVEAAVGRYAGKTLHYDNHDQKFDYTISKRSLTYAANHSGKSENPGVHTAVMDKLDAVIAESIEIMEHPDVRKKNGSRSEDNGYNTDALMHRFAGAVSLDGTIHRVITTLKEDVSQERNGLHTYEVTKIEVLDDNAPSTPNGIAGVYMNSTVRVANLLKGAEIHNKSGEKILQESQLNSSYPSRLHSRPGDVSKIDVLNEESPSTSNELESPTSSKEGTFPAAKLINGVEKSYDKGKKNLQESQDDQSPKSRDDRRSHMRNHATGVADRLGIQIGIIESPQSLPPKLARAKGWFDISNGKITIILGNHADTADITRTILHEAVAHKGLRDLFNDRFDQFLDHVYLNASRIVKEKIDSLAARNGWDRREATEEYLASLAEETDFRNTPAAWWRKIKTLFSRFLRACGLDSIAPISDNELRYILWISYKNLQDPGAYRSYLGQAERIAMESRLGVGQFSPHKEANPHSHLRFRDPGFSPRDHALAADVYDSMMRKGSFQFQEAMQDSMLSLKKLMQAIKGGKTYIEDIPGFENPYLAENRMSSQNNAEQHEYFRQYMTPLLQEVGKLCGSDAVQRRALSDYMMAKHGLERNEVLARRDAEQAMIGSNEENDLREATKALAADPADAALQKDLADAQQLFDEALDKKYQANRKRDYSGLTALTGIPANVHAEAKAQEMVDRYEAAHDTSPLWDATQAATGATLRKLYISGILSEETFNSTLAMFRYYIPLRGWDAKTSDEVYDYVTDADGPLHGNVFRHAEGRRSKADDPIAYIAQMADDAIRQGNRNIMKQRFLNFVLNNPSDLVAHNDLWLQKDAVSGEWQPVFADIDEDMTPQQVSEAVSKFNEKMRALQKANPDSYRHGKEARAIPYKVRKENLRQHQVLVRRDGVTKVLTINGSPRAAQALNGLTNPDVSNEGIARLSEIGVRLNRELSALYTTRNPDFVVSNYIRDFLYSNAMSWVKEPPSYALRFLKNILDFNPANMWYLFDRWENGTLDRSDKFQAMFYDFMINGGETGFTSIKDIERHKKTIIEELRRQGSIPRQAWAAIGQQIDILNRSVENSARFAAFLTSRQMGRSIDRSIWDAKEVSVNFNKKGSGGKFYGKRNQTAMGNAGALMSGAGRSLFVFWNAGVQGMTNFGRYSARHPAKAAVAASAMFILGAVIPLLAQCMTGGDDDDENAYYNLPEYVRRSNICINDGDKWVAIPLPIEFRAIYGLGELATGAISGKERYSDSELAWQIAAQVSQILPIDVLEGGGGISPFVPSAVKPIAEAYFIDADNGGRSWSGLPIARQNYFNRNDPEYRRVFKSADRNLMQASRWISEASGGDEFRRGAIEINPQKVEYLLKGYLGGAFSFPEKLWKSVESDLGDRPFEWSNTPLANRVVKAGDERTAFRKLRNEYFNYLNETRETERLLRKYENAADDGIMGYAERADFLYNSDQYLRYEIFGEFAPDIDALSDAMKEETDKEALKDLEAEYYSVMRQCVNAMRDPQRFLNTPM